MLEIIANKKPEISRFIKKFQALFCLNWKFTAQSASSWGVGAGISRRVFAKHQVS
ncbi:hypothetical protein [Faecalibacterium prausnitzii]|jgi:hypothetical protein|uniref:hypothetical protein n=1 Tax=Faecalibacterium prausnitzii TaxID=853 RepID=UPI0018CC50B7|nr:hypothetical protein [Faecalibacterium prausnitzii]